MQSGDLQKARLLFALGRKDLDAQTGTGMIGTSMIKGAQALVILNLIADKTSVDVGSFVAEANELLEADQ